MKKIIIIGALLLGLALPGLAQDIISPGMSGVQTRNALNTAFSELLGVVDTVNETVRIGGIQITANAAEVNILDGALVNVTELNRLVGLPGNIVTLLAGKENSLGDPATSGYVLSSTAAGVRSWIAPGGGGSMEFPAGSGIPLVVTGTSWGTTITNNSANWNTSYTERRQWDGGATNLVASTGRTALGATTIGSNLFTLTNPSAVAFLQANVDNTVTPVEAVNYTTQNYTTQNYSTTGTGNIVLSTGATLTTVSITDVIKLTPTASPPSPAIEGMIYADTDHHLYYYNGTTWISMTD